MNMSSSNFSAQQIPPNLLTNYGTLTHGPPFGYLNLSPGWNKWAQNDSYLSHPFSTIQKHEILQTSSKSESKGHAPTKSGKRIRTVFTSTQILALEDEFRMHQYIPRKRRIEISEQHKLTERTIKIWFQNRRMKSKKKSNASLSPPDLSPPVFSPSFLSPVTSTHSSENQEPVNQVEPVASQYKYGNNRYDVLCDQYSDISLSPPPSPVREIYSEYNGMATDQVMNSVPFDMSMDLMFQEGRIAPLYATQAQEANNYFAHQEQFYLDNNSSQNELPIYTTL